MSFFAELYHNGEEGEDGWMGRWVDGWMSGWGVRILSFEWMSFDNSFQKGNIINKLFINYSIISFLVLTSLFLGRVALRR